ncbi:MAG: FAD-dependent oxidoreductase [Oscillospiraceae bacterium]|nr:FAD-dependent oxidoreductase [Oscillospiraceae bacterium]
MALNHFPHIYNPIDVGTMHMKNRIQYSPIVTNHCDFETGRVTHEMLDFAATQAQTGCGLVTIGSTPVDFDHGRDFYGCLSVTNDHDLSGLHMLTDEYHKYDCNLSTELIHAGQWSALNGDEAWVPSIMDIFPKDKSLYKEITRKDMDVVIENFMKATERCVKAGFDMVMCHIAHGNLLSAFLSTFWNHRNDAYGGSAKNRWKFPLEVMEAMYSVTKGNIPIEVRVVGNERLEGATDIRERIEFLKEASKYIDMLCVSTGTLFYGDAMCYNMPSYYVPNGCNVDVAAAFKEALGDKLAVSVVGGINTLEMAEDIIASGKADIVAMAKSLMADDRMIVKGERGQEKDIVPCMRCMYCLRTIGTDAPVHACAANPRLGLEYRYPRFIPARKHKKAMIIGGGPGGMFAAKTLGDRGHEVHIYDKADKLGGRLHEASALWLKNGFKLYLDYAVRKTYESAEVHLNTEVTPELIRAENPDVVIVAVGADEFVPPIKGIDGKNVVSVVDVDRGTVEVGKRVVVCGAGMSGSECAMGLGHEGHECTVVDMRPKSALYKNLKDFSYPIFFQRLEEANVQLMYETAVKEITDKGVVVTTADGEEKLIECDTVITAFGLRRNAALVEELKEIVPETYVIGDAKKIGVVGDATNDAYYACMQIDT